MANDHGDTVDRLRLTVELSAQLSAELEKMAAETGKTKADVLRLGLDFLSKANAARKEGMTVGAWSEDPERNVRKEREFVGGL